MTRDPNRSESYPVRGDARPVPDPTTLTTEALRRDVFALRELIEARQEAIRQSVKYEAEISCLRHDNVQRQMDVIAAQKREVSDLNQKALDAALAAAKEAVTKSEMAMREQVKAMTDVNITTTNGLRQVIDDVKTRMDRGEGQSKGSKDAWGYVIGFLGLIVAVVIAIVKH